jgi:choline dehydrogenase-like flavoprotein
MPRSAQDTVTIERYAHLLGDCRMGRDVGSGVVDALTIMALAARLADHLGRR